MVKPFRPMPSQVFIKEWLHYSPETGVFTRAKNPSTGSRICGQVAGTRRKYGYIYIGLKGLGQLAAHRLAWAYMHGAIPDNIEIDHVDGDPSNNRIENLRLASSSEQKRNKRVQSNNRSGLKGAYYHAIHKGKKWRTQIKVKDKLIFLGYYHTAQEAHEVYAAAAKEHFGEFARIT